MSSDTHYYNTEKKKMQTCLEMSSYIKEIQTVKTIKTTRIKTLAAVLFLLLALTVWP